MPVSSMEFSAVMAFVIGMASTLHCITMCGGMAAGLSASLPPSVRSVRRAYISYLLLYNAGRTVSYVLAGGVVGGTGAGLIYSFDSGLAHSLIHFGSTLVLLFAGLYLLGVFPGLAKLQFIGRPVWRILEPLGRRFLPVKNPFQALMYGVIWGWLPCGLAYAMLVWALASGSAFNGAAIMLGFGLGTIPTMLLAGFLSTWLLRVNKLPLVRAGAGICIIGVAFLYLHYHDHLDLKSKPGLMSQQAAVSVAARHEKTLLLNRFKN